MKSEPNRRGNPGCGSEPKNMRHPKKMCEPQESSGKEFCRSRAGDLTTTLLCGKQGSEGWRNTR